MDRGVFPRRPHNVSGGECSEGPLKSFLARRAEISNMVRGLGGSAGERLRDAEITSISGLFRFLMACVVSAHQNS